LLLLANLLFEEFGVGGPDLVKVLVTFLLQLFLVDVGQAAGALDSLGSQDLGDL
jgi:hypothetical protein